MEVLVGHSKHARGTHCAAKPTDHVVKLSSSVETHRSRHTVWGLRRYRSYGSEFAKDSKCQALQIQSLQLNLLPS
jgi:hypothetical protein